ncbi:MAG: PaaI family thioesterase [Rhodospirillaceae bacterium]|nr:PaaI family thioesterase [Rhodospirillaceae bacterium]
MTATPIDVATLPPIAVRLALGGEALAVDGGSGAARVRYTPGQSHANPAGTVFGGFLAAMIDDAAGLAAWFGGGRRPFVTAQLSVNYLRAARPGEPLLAEAALLGKGARQAFVDVRLMREADRKLVASATVLQTFTAEA